MNEPITVTFVEDEAFYIEAHNNNPRHAKYWVVSVGVIVLVGFCYGVKARIAFNHGYERWWEELLFVAAVTVSVMAFLSPAGKRWFLKRALKKIVKNPPGLGRIEFSSTGFTTASCSGDSCFRPWSSIYQIIQQSNGLLVYYAKRTYFWVPRRLFENQQGYDRVLAVMASNVNDFKPAKP